MRRLLLDLRYRCEYLGLRLIAALVRAAPIDVAGKLSAKLVKGAQLIVYAGAPHGLTETHKDQVNADLLKFIRA